MGSLLLLDIGFALALLMAVLLKFFFTERSIALPPGPPKLPLLENLRDVPTEKAWITFSDWGKKWGTVQVFLRVQGLAMNELQISFFNRGYCLRFDTRSAYGDPKLCEDGCRDSGQKEFDLL